MLSHDEQRDILLQDFQRWQARENGLSMDSSSRASIPHASNDKLYMRGIGFISPPAKYPNRKPRLSCAGYTEVRPDGTIGYVGTSPNVAVTFGDPPVTTVVPASSFARESDEKAPARQSTAAQGSVERPHWRTAADMPAIGNID